MARMPVDVHGYISWFAEFNQEDHEQPPVKQSKPAGKKKDSHQKRKRPKKPREKNGARGYIARGYAQRARF